MRTKFLAENRLRHLDCRSVIATSRHEGTSGTRPYSVGYSELECQQACIWDPKGACTCITYRKSTRECYFLHDCGSHLDRCADTSRSDIIPGIREGATAGDLHENYEFVTSFSTVDYVVPSSATDENPWKNNARRYTQKGGLALYVPREVGDANAPATYHAEGEDGVGV